MEITGRWFAVALVAGAVIRAAALSLPGTGDVDIWKIWSYNAAMHPTEVYGVGGTPTERRVISLHGATTTVNYPPLAMYELGAIGRVYLAVYDRQFPDTLALTATIKGAVVLSEAALIALMFVALRRLASLGIARWAVAAYWLNPASVLTGSALGYIDPFLVLPAVGGIVAALFGWPLAAGALAAAAVLTKPQAIMIAPAIALAVWNVDDPRPALVRLAVALAGAALMAAALVGPVIAAGAWPNMLLALSRLGHQDMLSGNACNLWWIVGYVVRAAYAVPDRGVWAAFIAPARILGISNLIDLGYPNARIVGTVMTAAVGAWGLWTARRARDFWLLAALGGFLVHVYATLAAQVHENHLFVAVPLLAIAAAGRRGFTQIFVAVSAIVALNLNIFYGISEGVGYAIPRDVTLIDLSVVLAAANCAALLWHARILQSECSRAASPRLSPTRS